MKKWIEEIKKRCLKIIDEYEGTPETCDNEKEKLNLIAEIESLEAELKLHKTPDNILVKEYQKLEKEIKQLQAVRGMAEEFITKNPNRVKTNSILRKLQQALAAKGKDEKSQ